MVGWLVAPWRFFTISIVELTWELSGWTSPYALPIHTFEQYNIPVKTSILKRATSSLAGICNSVGFYLQCDICHGSSIALLIYREYLQSLCWSYHTWQPEGTPHSAQTSWQNVCITFVQCWTNVEDVGPTLYKCYTNVLCLLGSWQKTPHSQNILYWCKNSTAAELTLFNLLD